MKKLLLIALLVGCGGNVPQATTTPDPVVEAPVVADNPFTGAVEVLYALVAMDSEQFEQFCWAIDGNLTRTGEAAACIDTDGSGFGHRVDETGVGFGAAMMVPHKYGQALADAVFQEVGEPHETVNGAALWDLSGDVLVFAPLSGGQWLLILEKSL